MFFFFFQAEDGIRYYKVTGVQTCALPISAPASARTSQPFAGSPVGRNISPASARKVSSGSRPSSGPSRLRESNSVAKPWEIGRASCRERGEITMKHGRCLGKHPQKLDYAS